MQTESVQMRLIYMGTPEFAVPPLMKLLESDHEVVLVISQPDKPSGRGRKIKPTAVKQLAESHHVEVFQPNRIKNSPEVIEKIKGLEPDLIVVAAYGKILPEEILNLPRLGCINLHASLLPSYRGAAPINWAMIDGRSTTGVTIMQMDKGMDTGAIILQEEIPILEDDDAKSLTDMLSMVGAQAMLKVIDQAEVDGSIPSTAQDESLATLAPLLTKQDGLLDWDQPMEKIIFRIRGLIPWPGAWCETKKGILKILSVEPVWESVTAQIEMKDDIAPGVVVLVLKEHGGIAVRCGDGFVMITQAQPAGKRVMRGTDLINGKIIKIGDLLAAH